MFVWLRDQCWNQACFKVACTSSYLPLSTLFLSLRVCPVISTYHYVFSLSEHLQLYHQCSPIPLRLSLTSLTCICKNKRDSSPFHFIGYLLSVWGLSAYLPQSCCCFFQLQISPLHLCQSRPHVSAFYYLTKMNNNSHWCQFWLLPLNQGIYFCLTWFLNYTNFRSFNNLGPVCSICYGFSALHLVFFFIFKKQKQSITFCEQK